MPLSEAYLKSMTGKSESIHSNRMSNYSSDLSSFMPENELVELLWDNGQIATQGQSNRKKKSSIAAEFAFQGKNDDKRGEDDASLLKFGQDGFMDSQVQELSPTVPCLANVQEDDAAPWLNYPIDDSLQSDFCSEFFSELTGGVHMAASWSNASGSKISGHGQLARDSNIIRSSPSVDIKAARHQKQDAGSQKPLQQNSGMSLMNFPHFSRPGVLVKTNLQSIDRLKSLESTPAVESRHGLTSLDIIHRSIETPSNAKVDWKSNEKATVYDAVKVNRNCSPPDLISCHSSSFAISMAVERADAGAASSSACSGYVVGEASNGPKHIAKKRALDGEEEGEQSDDLDDESLAEKKPRITSGKRSRAAEVHNLSERRRRDRINEKMRALQDLIPNCNKVDKASMLDEAIEYLKTLQLQVQMMSMGSGLCVHPMMIHTGMNFQPISHFTPLMGMGQGFGMGMIDLNGLPGLIPVSPFPSVQLPCHSVQGEGGFHRLPPTSTIQSLPSSIPHAALFSSHTGISPQSPLMENANKQASLAAVMKTNKEFYNAGNATVNPVVNRSSQPSKGEY